MPLIEMVAVSVEREREDQHQAVNDLRSYLDVLIRRWRWVAVMTILALLAATILTLATRPVYEATAVISLSPATLSVPTSSQAPPYYYVVDSPSRLPIAHSPTFYVDLLKSGEMAKAISSTLPVSIGVDGSDKSLIDITARGSNPSQVTQIANAWAEAGTLRLEQALKPDANEVSAALGGLKTAEQDLAHFSEANSLGELDVNRLRTVAGLSTDKRTELDQLLRNYDVAESVYLDLAKEQARENLLAANSNKPIFISAAIPAAPVAPKPTQNLALGGVLGLLVGVLSAFAVEYMTHS